MTQDDLQEEVEREIRSLSSNFEDEDYEGAIADAMRETGFSLPTSDDFQIQWLKDRTKRHLFFMLYTESAHKFKVKQISLNQRFDHYDKLIKVMDEKFEKALDEEVFKFAGVDAKQAFGTQISSGFAYDRLTGEDITYQDENLVTFKPSDTD